MTKLAWGAMFVVLCGLGTTARASDPVGIYALVERVVIEPKDDAPERVQVWGVFALADNETRRYTPPARGFMYFQLPAKKADVAKKEWSDLKKLAGSGQCVAFGQRYETLGTVRKKSDKAEKPDSYPLGVGVQKIAEGRGMAKELKAFKPTCGE